MGVGIPPSSHRLPSKKPSARFKIISSRCWFQGGMNSRGPLPPNNTGNCCCSWNCPPELDGKTLLLKIPHTLVPELGEIKLVLTWKPPPCWLAFIVLEGAIHAVETEKSSPASPSYKLWDWSGRIMGAIGAWMLWSNHCFWLGILFVNYTDY